MAGGRVASLLSLAQGAHLAWERHRFCPRTPRGTVCVGMTPEEVTTVLGIGLGGGPNRTCYGVDGGTVGVDFGSDGRVSGVTYTPTGQAAFRTPRPSLFEAARSWLTG